MLAIVSDVYNVTAKMTTSFESKMTFAQYMPATAPKALPFSRKRFCHMLYPHEGNFIVCYAKSLCIQIVLRQPLRKVLDKPRRTTPLFSMPCGR